jgi:large subunit ribosomal protein L21e
MKRIGGARRKSRSKMRKSVSEKGKFYISKYLQEFDIGQRVLLKAEPSYQGGIFCLRFYGKIGNVVSKQGNCYKVELKDGNKLKQFIVHPIHLVRV